MDMPTENILPSPNSTSERTSLTTLALLFLRLGITAFGGPAAHIAMMEEETVRRRQWLTKEEFLDLLGTANLIPGPNSTEMAILIGYRRAGLPGLLVAGLCFILPSAFLVLGFAMAYKYFGRLPQIAGLLYGVKPVMIAIVAQALWGLSRTAIKTRALGVLGLGATVAAFASVHPLPILFLSGASTAGGRWFSQERKQGVKPLLVLLGLGALLLLGPFSLTTQAVGVQSARFGIQSLFFFFLKVGSVLYGSGYVLLAFLRADLVSRWHWLTSAQLLDATAVGQVTPGPVFTTATFIGYLLGGPWGALAATVGIFLPAFVFVGISGPLVARLRQSPLAGAFLDGVNVAALALMLVVTCQLGQSALVDPLTITVALVSLIALLRFRVSSVWLVLAGATLGLLVAIFRVPLR